MKRFLSVFLVLWMGVVILFVFNRSRHKNGPLPELGAVPEFTLMDQRGRGFSESHLRGKVWIADFIFTRCAGPCPLMTQQLMNIAQDLAAEPDIRFVSFSVDPDYDTPKVLGEYADKFLADANRWFFLTGTRTWIYDLAIKHFHLAAGGLAEEGSGHILHSTKFVLVDHALKIRGYYDSLVPEQLQRLRADAKKLAAETGAAHAA